MKKTKLSLYDPSSVFSDNFLSSFFDDSTFFKTQQGVDLEMYEDDKDITVNVSAAGFDKDDFNVSIEGKLLTIKGESKENKKEEDKNKRYYYKEMKQETFTRSVSLPCEVVPQKIKANYKAGILSIRLPKSQDKRDQRVNISID